jgi:formylmethanofuran dehydrogenase subunit A
MGDPALASGERGGAMLRIKGGKVYDPVHGQAGVVRDVCIADGRIVENVSGGRVIDARGMVVLPGGVDIHTHIAGAAINFAREMIAEDHRRAVALVRTPARRAGIGGVTPSTFATGYMYASMGWTTIFEAAVPVLTAKHTHEELHDTPIVDKGCYLLIGNNEIVLDLLEAEDYERARHVVAWLLWAAKAYGLKAVNPGGVAAWKWGQNVRGLFEPVPGYQRVTPARIITALAQIAEDLRLPHPLHLHCNQLGLPGNFATTLETMKILEGRRAHLAHLQFHAYGGDDWTTFRSEAPRIAEYLNDHPNLTADAGAVLFGDTVTVTADGPWQYLLYRLTGHKWGNMDIENETGCGIVPYAYRQRNLVNAVQWAVGLELLLLVRDPWRIFLTTDHPNGGAFWRYPEMIRLLMDADYRREWLKALPPKALSRIYLPDIDREYSLSEIVIITSAGPARALGLSHKGHLGVGADADIVIYDGDPDPGRMFARPRYVIKGGEVVVEDGEVRQTVLGREFVVRPNYDEAIEAFLQPLFEHYYTVSFANYPVELERVHPVEVRPLGE